MVSVTSTSHAGEPIHAVHPHLRGFYDLAIAEKIDRPRLLDAEHAVLFSALPHGISGATLDELLDELDCGAREGDRPVGRSSAERRRRARERVSGVAAAAGASRGVRLRPAGVEPRADSGGPLRRQSGLPGDCGDSGRRAAGRTREFRGPLVIDAKTGSSGAGRVPKETTHHPTRHADFRAYKPLAHQHEPEILQALGDPSGQRIELSFVPQSMAVSRGIFATVHATLAEPADASGARCERYEQFYAGSPFVRVAAGSPALEDVVGSNFCDIGVAARGRQVVVMSAIDNLVKGMAGAAIQNMNLMCGLPETTGLWTPSLRPV